jgi:hypothetical protein
MTITGATANECLCHRYILLPSWAKSTATRHKIKINHVQISSHLIAGHQTGRLIEARQHESAQSQIGHYFHVFHAPVLRVQSVRFAALQLDRFLRLQNLSGVHHRQPMVCDQFDQFCVAISFRYRRECVWR